jgi:hypothetical protein
LDFDVSIGVSPFKDAWVRYPLPWLLKAYSFSPSRGQQKNMALISKETTCPLCEELISGPVFSTSGIFFPPTDPLWRYCDAAMHWACYATWEHRERFAREYVQMWIENEKHNPYWARVFFSAGRSSKKAELT